MTRNDTRVSKPDSEDRFRRYAEKVPVAGLRINAETFAVVRRLAAERGIGHTVLMRQIITDWAVSSTGLPLTAELNPKQ